MKSKPERVAAAIEIGSTAVRMHVAQWSHGRLSLLDQLERPISIGHEVFASGRVSYAIMRELSGILTGFCRIAREYGAARIRTVATTALREAANRDHLLDHLLIQNKLEVEVLEPTEANAYLFDGMLRGLPRPLAERATLTYAGTGTIAIAYLDSGQVTYSQIHNTGLLKISEMMRAASERSRHPARMVADHLYSLNHPIIMQIGALEFDDHVMGGGDIDLFAKICSMRLDGDCARIKRADLEQAHADYGGLSPDHLSARFGISFEDGELLHSMLLTFQAFAELTNMREFYYARVDLLSSLLTLQLSASARRRFEDGLRIGTRASVMSMARRYNSHMPHVTHTARVALMMYEKLRRLHALSRRQGVLLDTACILHEIGYIANSDSAPAVSYDLLKNAYIYGLSSKETQLVAYMMLDAGTRAQQHLQRMSGFTTDEWLFISKMHTLMALASALDQTRLQKAETVKVELKQNRMLIYLRVRGDYSLEQWMFKDIAPQFEEAFGMEPVLEIEQAGPLG